LIAVVYSASGCGFYAPRAMMVSSLIGSNPNWLVPGFHGPGRQGFGDQLLKDHPFSLLPSTVSHHSWNLIFDADRAKGYFDDVQQERFALDPRLHRNS